MLDLHVFPINIEFFRDQHGQHRLDALANLGILGHDRHNAVRRDADEAGRRRFPAPGAGKSPTLEFGGWGFSSCFVLLLPAILLPLI